MDRASPRALRRRLRAPVDLLDRLREGAAAAGVLLCPLLAPVLFAARAALDAGAAADVPAAGGRARGAVCRRRLRRVRDENAVPEPEADRGKRRPRVLHGQ